MYKAVMNTIIGMGTVFIVLIFISFIIGLFKYISVFENKKKAKNEQLLQHQRIHLQTDLLFVQSERLIAGGNNYEELYNNS